MSYVRSAVISGGEVTVGLPSQIHVPYLPDDGFCVMVNVKRILGSVCSV